MEKIPKSFKVFASHVNVTTNDNIRLSNNQVLGDCSFSDLQINICTEYKGESVASSTATDTFYHEKVHIILDAMGEHELSQNEKFVEVFARLLRQTDETAIYE